MRKASALIAFATIPNSGIAKSVVITDGLTEMRVTDDPVQNRCLVVASSGSYETDMRACERALIAMPSNTEGLPEATYLFPGRDRRYAGGTCAYPNGWRPPTETICTQLLAAMGSAKVAKAIEPENWVQPTDLKTASGNAGSVLVSVGISPAGRATYCTVVQSSQNALLDSAICRAIHQRAKFDPELDKDGQPISSAYARRWTF